MDSLTFQNWDEYTLTSGDGFLSTANYKTEANETDKRTQLQTQHSQTRDYLNNKVKPAVDTLQAHSIVSADENLTITKANNVTTIKVNVSPSGEATKEYVDQQDATTLQSAKDYTDSKDTYTTCTLPTFASAGSQAITVIGITADANPILDVVISNASDKDSMENDWSHIYKAISSANTITFYSDSATMNTLTIAIKGY